MTKSVKKVLQRVPLEVSFHWLYLHQDGRKTWLEISKMKSYRKYSKTTICRHMVKKNGDPLLHKWKQNQGRPTKLSDRQKRNILRQAEVLQEDVGNFGVKRVMIRASIPPSIRTATVQVMRKAPLKWTHTQKKRVLTKSDLKLRLRLAQKVRRKLSKGFSTGGLGFYFHGACFTHKMNSFDQARAPRAMVWIKPGQGLDFGFFAKESHEEKGERVAKFMEKG